MPEAVFDVDLVEVGNHVLSLVFGVINFFDAVENDGEDDFVGQDACVVQEVAVALLDAFDGGLEHVFGLTVDADADRQLDSPFGGPLEQRQQSVAGRVSGLVGVLVEAADLLFVDRDGEDLLLFKFVGMVFVAFDDHEAVILVEPYFGGHEEYLGEEVLLFEQLFVVWLF